MRKEQIVTITAEGRDKGKAFLITEKPALPAWKWGIRALLALTKTGVQIPDEIMKMGMVGLLAVGIHRLQFVDWGDLEPLLNELLECVQFLPTPSRRDIVRPVTLDGINDDIEDPGTYSVLVKEVFGLHTGFFPSDNPSTSPVDGAATGGSQ